MNETKQKILDVALDLFSQNGFSAVSIRDICKVVDIKESSVYYHFTARYLLSAVLIIPIDINRENTFVWKFNGLSNIQ